MVKVKVILGKIAVGVVGNKDAGIKEEETRVYRRGDIFDCPEDRLDAVSSSNQIEILEKPKSLEHANVYGATDRNPAETTVKSQPAAQSPVKK